MKLDIDNTAGVGGCVLVVDTDGVELPYKFIEIDTETFTAVHHVCDADNKFSLNDSKDEPLTETIQIPNTSKFICAETRLSIFNCDCNVCVWRRSNSSKQLELL